MRKRCPMLGVGLGVAALSGLAFAEDQNKSQNADQKVQVQGNLGAQQSGGLQQISVRRLSQLTSGDIKNQKGEDLGRITALVLDAGSDRIAYAILDFGGFLGIRDKEFAVPWAALQKKIYHDNYDKISYTLNVEKDRLKNAKGFDRNQWPNLTDAAWARDVHQFWGQQPYWEDRTHVSVRAGREGVDVDVNRQPTIEGTPISPEDKARGKAMHMRHVLVRSDRLVGHDVTDRNGKRFGELEDVMVDAQSGSLVYGIIQINESPDLDKDYLNPVPFALLDVLPTAGGDAAGDVKHDETVGTDKDRPGAGAGHAYRGKFLADKDAFKVVFTGSMDQLNAGPKFPERNWPMMDQNWGQQVYSHYGVKPSWQKQAGAKTEEGHQGHQRDQGSQR